MVTAITKKRKYDVIIDGINVGTAFEFKRQFRVERIERALEFFRKQQKTVIAVVSSLHHYDQCDQAHLRRLISEKSVIEIAGGSAELPPLFEHAILNFWLLHGHDGVPKDHLDSRSDAAVIITNNKYKQLDKWWLPEVINRVRSFILIPFTFESERFEALR
ncbi:Zc3h12a-like Ribonuclease NYN [Gracilaria domingensis]|nr:Zc3h12a-like Ribonuclease NYN [Gracilaria domingensis]